MLKRKTRDIGKNSLVRHSFADLHVKCCRKVIFFCVLMNIGVLVLGQISLIGQKKKFELLSDFAKAKKCDVKCGRTPFGNFYHLSVISQVIL